MITFFFDFDIFSERPTNHALAGAAHLGLAIVIRPPEPTRLAHHGRFRDGHRRVGNVGNRVLDAISPIFFMARGEKTRNKKMQDGMLDPADELVHRSQ